MKVEIWSDVMCPFCYIGKRHFEAALKESPFKEEIEVQWKSYQLNPEYHNKNGEDLYTYLARSKGMSISQVKEMTGQVTEMAARAGIELDFENNIPANTFDAHRLIHLAAKHDLQDVAEEQLFDAHFTKQADIGNHAQLLAIASEIGLDQQEATGVLNTDEYKDAVRHDIYESRQLGVRGVPYFVLDRKYAISGAQPVEVFKQALSKSFDEWKASQPLNKLTSLNQSQDGYCSDEGCEL